MHSQCPIEEKSCSLTCDFYIISKNRNNDDEKQSMGEKIQTINRSIMSKKTLNGRPGDQSLSKETPTYLQYIRVWCHQSQNKIDSV